MARPKKNPTEHETLSPENIDGADPARTALKKERKSKAKRDPFIDKAVEWISDQENTTGGYVDVEVRALLKEVYALPQPDAAAVMGFLKQVKMDGRLLIESVGMDTKLALSTEAVEPNEAVADPAPDIETKTIGEHVADAQGKPTKLPFPHDIGTWVCFGELEKAPCKIVNIHTTGNISLYDLKSEYGDNLKGIPASEISQLSSSEEGRIKAEEHNRALQKHADRGVKLAQRRAEIMAQEVADTEALKATRKRLKAIEEKIDIHLGMLPDNGQQELDLEVEDDGIEEEDDGAGLMTSAEPVTEPFPDTSTAQERLLGRITGKDTLELPADSPVWKNLDISTLKCTASTGKPPTVKPLAIEQAPGKWVCVDVQDGIAVLLRAYTKAEWNTDFREKFGDARDLPNQTQTAKQEAGGPMAGFPVKVGRATLYLAPLDEALLLKLPAAVAQA